MAEIWASLYAGYEEERARWDSLTPEQQAVETAAADAKSAEMAEEMARKEADRKAAFALLNPVIDGLVAAGIEIDAYNYGIMRKNATLGGAIAAGSVKPVRGTYKERIDGRTRYVTETRDVWVLDPATPCVARTANFPGTGSGAMRLEIGITDHEVIVVFTKPYAKNPTVLRAARSSI